MFGRQRTPAPSAPSSVPGGRRHGRREPRSSLGGPGLPAVNSRVARFSGDARAAVQLLQSLLPIELQGVQFGFQTVPGPDAPGENPMFYSVDRASQTIVLYRMPIQRMKGLHVDDDEHRRYFVEYCAYQAVCEYLGREPWDLLPGRFEHF